MMELDSPHHDGPEMLYPRLQVRVCPPFVPPSLTGAPSASNCLLYRAQRASNQTSQLAASETARKELEPAAENAERLAREIEEMEVREEVRGGGEGGGKGGAKIIEGEKGGREELFRFSGICM